MTPATDASGATRLRPRLLLFLALFAVYNSNLRPIGSGDTLPGSLLPLALVLDHTLTLDRFGPSFPGNIGYALHRTPTDSSNDSHWYSAYPIAGQVLIAPLYLPLVAVPRIREWSPEALTVLAKILAKVMASAIAALSAVVFLMLLRRLTSSPWAWALVLVYALGTETWSISSQSLWQHTFGQLGIACALLFLDRWSGDTERSRWLWACGAAAGFALMARISNVMLLPALALGLLAGKARIGQLLRFGILPLLGAALTAGYNLQVFGKAAGYYSEEIVATIGRTWVQGGAGMLLSPGRGLFVYSPVLLFALAAFLPGARASRARHRPLLMASVGFIVLHSVIIAKYPIWWGGNCWGPRYMTEIGAPLIVLMGLGLPAIFGSLAVTRAFVVLALYSVLIQAVGVYFYPHGLWDVTPVSVDQAPERVWDWKDNPIVRSVRGGMVTKPYVLLGVALRQGKSGLAREIEAMRLEGY